MTDFRYARPECAGAISVRQAMLKATGAGFAPVAAAAAASAATLHRSPCSRPGGRDAAMTSDDSRWEPAYRFGRLERRGLAGGLRPSQVVPIGTACVVGGSRCFAEAPREPASSAR